LSVGVLTGANDGVDPDPSGDGIERVLQSDGEDVEGVGHDPLIVADDE
jgi:hypothetical protein